MITSITLPDSGITRNKKFYNPSPVFNKEELISEISNIISEWYFETYIRISDVEYSLNAHINTKFPDSKNIVVDVYQQFSELMPEKTCIIIEITQDDNFLKVSYLIDTEFIR